MKHGVGVGTLLSLLFAMGCSQQQQVKVTYLSEPPGGTLYKLDGELWGECPKVLYYDIGEEDIESGYIDAKGLMVRWPSGPDKRSDELIRFAVDGTDREFGFVQPEETSEGYSQQEQVRVTYRSDPPGGTLYKLDGEPWGECPKVHYYDIGEEDIKRGYIDTKGLMVRWPSGLAKRSPEPFRITVDGTNRMVTFVQPDETSESSAARSGGNPGE